MPNIAFLNGRFMPLSRAKVSVEDRGFQFGDGIYELIRASQGRILFLEEHLSRFERNARELSLDLLYTRNRWARILTEAYRRSGFREARLYLQLTRGVAPRNHLPPGRVRPTVVVTVRRHLPVPASLIERGVSVVTVADNRWGRCDIKTINLLPNVLAKEKARTQGGFEAVFVKDGMVTEGATSNLFAWIGGMLKTPPVAANLLPGITRVAVMGIAKSAGVTVREEPFTLEALYGAEEAFLTGTTVDVLPVVEVDRRPIGRGVPGPWSRKLREMFLASIHPEA